MKNAVIYSLIGGAIVIGGIAVYLTTGGFGTRTTPPQSPGTTAPQPAAPKSDDETNVAAKPDEGQVSEPQQPAQSTETPPATQSAQPSTGKAPEFDIVRVEPSGDAVIAGQSDPGAMVAVIDNGKVIGRTTANDQGEWVMVLKKPLKPGDHDLTVKSESNGQSVESDQRVAVAVEEDRKSAPLVVLSKPGQPSKVVQKPVETKTADAAVKSDDGTAPTAKIPPAEEPGETVVARVEPPQTDGPAAVPADRQPTEPQTNFETTPGQSDATTPDQPATAAQPNETPATETAKAEQPAAAPQPSQEQTPAPDSQGSTAASTTPQSGTDQPAAPAPLVQTPAEPTATAQAPKPAAPPVVVKETEVADNQVTVNGTSDPGAEVEVRINDRPVGTTKADENGNWTLTLTTPAAPSSDAPKVEARQRETEQPATKSVAAAPPAPKPEIQIAAASTQNNRIKVTGRATPGARIQVTVGGVPVGTATADASGEWSLDVGRALPPGNHAVRADLVSPDGSVAVADRATITRDHDPMAAVEAVEVENDRLYIAGVTVPSGRVRVYVDDQFVGEAKAGPSGRWLLEAGRSLEPGRYRVRADQVTGDKGRVVARGEVPFEREAETVALRPVSVSGEGSGAGATGATTSGTLAAPQAVIIRRGDNLWRISRRHYGRGIRYTTIYRANTDQIRDPNWIYPGQVFTMPKSDMAWETGTN